MLPRDHVCSVCHVLVRELLKQVALYIMAMQRPIIRSMVLSIACQSGAHDGGSQLRFSTQLELVLVKYLSEALRMWR